MTAISITPHKTFSPGRVIAIASNTLLELVRLKVFYFLLFFSLACIGVSLLFVQLTSQEQFQVLKDVSLGAMSIFLWLLAVLPTAMLLPKDVEDRTLYTILAKPVPRFEYLLGKLLGVLALLLIATLLMSGVFFIVLYSYEQKALADTVWRYHDYPPERLAAELLDVRRSAFNVNLIQGITLLYIKAAFCASMTLFIATFSSSWIFTVIVSVIAYFIGNVQWIAREAWQDHTGNIISTLFLAAVSIFFPDLHVFTIVDDVATGLQIPMDLFLKAAGLGLSYTAFYLVIAYLVFAWKEL